MSVHEGDRAMNGQPGLAQPLVSIVIPVLNGERYIRDALTNCLSQSLASLEVIVVDGGSVDQTLEICRSFDDDRLHVHQQPDNRHRLPGALNWGFARTRGKYLTWTHDDNLYAPDALEKMVNVLENQPNVGLVYSDYWLVKADLAKIRRVEVGPAGDLVYRNCVGPSFLYRSEVYHRIGDYDPDAVLQEDYEYWIRVTRQFGSSSIPEPLYYYRVHEASLTGRFRRDMFDQFIKIRSKYFPQVSSSGKRSALAEWYMAWAFEDYYSGSYHRALAGVANGILRRPAFLLNRGVLRIGWESVRKLLR